MVGAICQTCPLNFLSVPTGVTSAETPVEMRRQIGFVQLRHQFHFTAARDAEQRRGTGADRLALFHIAFQNQPG